MASEPMTPERLARIRARADAATPGPWSQVEPLLYVLMASVDEDAETRWDNAMSSLALMVGPLGTGACGVGGGFVIFAEDPDRVDVKVDKLWSDTAFIAAARADVPDLLAEVERLKQIVAGLVAAADQ